MTDQQVTFWPCGCMANKFGNHGEACRHPLPRVQSPLPAECCEGVCDGIPHDDDCETPLWEEIDRLKRERDELRAEVERLTEIWSAASVLLVNCESAQRFDDECEALSRAIEEARRAS